MLIDQPPENLMTDIRRDVRAFLQNDLSRDLTDVDDSTSLLQAGVLDSLGVMQLVAFLQQRFDLVVADDDLVPENLESVDAIVAFVTRLQHEPA
jgi:acyl carrier protein